MRNGLRFLFSLLVLAPAAATGQVAPGGHVLEVNIRDRWINQRQQPRFVPFSTLRRLVYIDSMVTGASERVLYARLNRGEEAHLRTDLQGRLLDAGLTLAPPSNRPESPLMQASLERLQRMENQQPSLLGMRVWDVLPVFAPPRETAGARWTDTIRVSAADGAYRQTWSGVRVSVLLRDTMIAGRRHWWVRDSASIRYEEDWLEQERTLDTLVATQRVADGVSRGHHLFDPERHLFITSADSVTLSGRAVLRYPDGRSFSTPTRFERYRTRRLYDAVGLAARQQELRAAQEAERGGMVIVPANAVQERLNRGDVRARDSLIAIWDRTTDADERARIHQLLIMWSRGSETRALLTERARAAGDTTYLAGNRMMGIPAQLDSAALGFMLAFMNDPGLAFAFNVSRDAFHENIRQALLTYPPAVTRDVSRLACVPAVCASLERAAATSNEPRLRDLALISRFVADPRRWAAELEARAAAGSAFVKPALLLARGVGATWPAAAKHPMPAAGADWRVWLDWLMARDPLYPAPPGQAQRQRIRFENSHTNAIRFYSAVTGRDIVSEVRRGYETGRDSARIVFGTMLVGLGELPADPASVAARFRSNDPVEHELAGRQLSDVFRSATPADSATAVELADRLLRAVLEGAPLWPVLEGTTSQANLAPGNIARDVPLFISRSNIPAALHEWVGARATLITDEEWAARDKRQAGMLFDMSPIVVAGPFVRINVSYSVFRDRTPQQAPSGYASGTTLWLLRTESGWVVVGTGGWIT
jgi:hypothetical protein